MKKWKNNYKPAQTWHTIINYVLTSDIRAAILLLPLSILYMKFCNAYGKIERVANEINKWDVLAAQ